MKISEKINNFVSLISCVGLGDNASRRKSNKAFVSMFLAFALILGVSVVSCSSSDNPTQEEVWEFNYNDGSTETLVCDGLHQATHYVYYVLEGETYKTRIPYESLKNYKRIR